MRRSGWRSVCAVRDGYLAVPWASTHHTPAAVPKHDDKDVFKHCQMSSGAKLHPVKKALSWMEKILSSINICASPNGLWHCPNSTSASWQLPWGGASRRERPFGWVHIRIPFLKLNNIKI